MVNWLDVGNKLGRRLKLGRQSLRLVAAAVVCRKMADRQADRRRAARRKQGGSGETVVWLQREKKYAWLAGKLKKMSRSLSDQFSVSPFFFF